MERSGINVEEDLILRELHKVFIKQTVKPIHLELTETSEFTQSKMLMVCLLEISKLMEGLVRVRFNSV